MSTISPLPSPPLFHRVIWVILDGVGAGELPDAATYGDQGSNTLANLASALVAKTGRHLKLPHMEAWGLGNITAISDVPPRAPGNGFGASGRAREVSAGKDTTSGHWEMAGLVVTKPFVTFSNGFPDAIVERWVRENNLPGALGNKAASGTEIIQELGEESLRTGKPILYTSADSVWQVAAHEQKFGLDRLYAICKSARKICDELQVGRVIARPFVGEPAKGSTPSTFKRTYHRKDYAQIPFRDSMLDELVEQGIPTLGLGKISSIYAGRGIQENIDTEGNSDGLRQLLEQMEKRPRGLIYCNLIDFDMLYGHRRDVPGFATALEEFDAVVPELRKRMGPKDLLLIAADHGNDPTYRGTDHTREFIPLLAFSPAQTKPGPANLGTRDTFADVGATVVHALLGSPTSSQGLPGRSFLPEMGF